MPIQAVDYNPFAPAAPQSAPADDFVSSLLPVARQLENSGDTAVSPRGAIGPYQIMPATARGLGRDPARLTEPQYNEDTARDLLTQLHGRFGDDKKAILAAYNSTPQHAEAYRKSGYNAALLPPETQKYLHRAATLIGDTTAAPAQAQGSAVPVEGDPFAGQKVVPVDHDPFAASAKPKTPSGLDLAGNAIATIAAGVQHFLNPSAPDPRAKVPAPAANAIHDPGLLGSFTHGVEAGVRNLGQGLNAETGDRLANAHPKDAISDKYAEFAPEAVDWNQTLSLLAKYGKTPAPAQTTATQPMSGKDLLNPYGLTEKVLNTVGEGAPALAAATVSGPIGAGVVTGAQAIGPYYEQELKKTPDDPDGALNRAHANAAVDGVATALTWKLFEVMPFKTEVGKITNELTGEAATVYKKTIGDTIKNLSLQGLGIQGGAAVVTNAIHNVLGGKPWDDGMAPAYTQGVIGNTIMAGLGSLFGRMSVGKFKPQEGAFAYDPGAHFGDGKTVDQGEPPGGPGGGPAPRGALGPGQTPKGPAPGGAPPPDTDIGMKFPGGRVERVTIKGYSPDGKTAHLEFEDGSIGESLTSEVLRDMAPAPESRAESAPPNADQHLRQGEAPVPPFEEAPPPPPSARAAARMAAREPKPNLFPDATHALDMASRLEAAALDETQPMSTQDRQAALLQAGRLRQQFTTEGEETRPSAYRHPLSGEPAAEGLPDLAAARVANPGLYETTNRGTNVSQRDIDENGQEIQGIRRSGMQPMPESSGSGRSVLPPVPSSLHAGMASEILGPSARGEGQVSQPSQGHTLSAPGTSNPGAVQGMREPGEPETPPRLQQAAGRDLDVPSLPHGAASPDELRAEGHDIAAAGTDLAPTSAQQTAGNYAKGKIRVSGIPVSIETPRGEVRGGVGADGQPWEVRNNLAHYGYITRTGQPGTDGDHIDAYVGQHPTSPVAYVVDQVDPKTGTYDEHKVILAAKSEKEAKDIYNAGFSDGSGPQRMGAITKMPMVPFKEWLKKGDLQAPINAMADPDYQAALRDVRAARSKAKTEPDILATIQGLGGLRLTDHTGNTSLEGKEIRNVLRDYQRPGLINNRTGMTPDYMREALTEQGWFGDRDAGHTDIGDLYDMLDRAVRGQKVFHPESDANSIMDGMAILDEELGRAGVASSDSPADAAKKLLDFRRNGALELAADHWSEVDHEAENLSPGAHELLTEYGYEPGADIGAEFEAQPEESARYPETQRAVEPEREGQGHGPKHVEEPEGRRASDAESHGAETLQHERPVAAAENIPPLAPHVGSWIVVDRATSKPVVEIFKGDKSINNINFEKYEAIPANEYLGALNKPPVTVEAGEAVDGHGSAVPQTVAPGAERTAKQLAAAREAAGHGRSRSSVEQQDAGGMFAPKTEETADMFAAPPQKVEPAAKEPAPTAIEPRAPKTITLPEYDGAAKRFRAGDMTAAEAMQHFENLAVSGDSIKAELRAYPKDHLAKMDPRNRNESKIKLADSIYSSMLNSFNAKGTYSWSPSGFGGKESGPESGIRRAMEAQTDQDIKDYAEERKKRIAERQQTYTDPQTLTQFRDFIHLRGLDKLTPDQRIRYDGLVADDTRSDAERQKAQKQIVKGVDLGDVKTEIIETKHTQKGHALFVVKLSDRVERDTYDRLVKAARSLGGNYSSYARDGAVPGFQFRNRGAADSFVALKDGDVSKADVVAKREAEVKGNAVERLRSMADKMTDDADESLNADRKTNTARRANQAAGAEAVAQANKAMATTMRNLADAIEGGDVRYLDAIRTRADVETLNTLARRAQIEWARAEQKRDPSLRYEKLTEGPVTPGMIDAAKYPWPYVHVDNARNLAKAVENKPGLKRMAAALMKEVTQANRAESWQVVGDTLGTQEMLREVAQGAVKAGERGAGNNPWKWEGESVLETFKDYDRAQRMGLTNPPTMRAALREFLKYRGSAAKADPIKAAERALIGTKIPGYFPTPPRVVDRMLEEADIGPGMSVLEPSAGKGNILDRLQDAAPDLSISAIEPHSSLRQVLEMKGANVVGHDFLEYDGKHDRIVMNPPFEDRQDVTHVQHAYDLLNPGGRVVAIMSEGPFFGADKKAEEFRAWLDKVGGTSEKLPQGSFIDSERSTGVATRLVTISKDADLTPKYSVIDTLFGGKKANEPPKTGTEHVGIGADLKRMIDLFGPKMYGSDMPQVTAKELLQNSFDGVKAALQRGDIQPGEGNIDITYDQNGRTLSFTDNGAGMTPQIVKDAFLTVAGTDKGDLSEAERSGGFGVAKLAFIFGNDGLRLETVRDGMRTTLDTNSQELLDGKADLKTTPALNQKNGTTVTVTFPQTYLNPRNGEREPLSLPWRAESFEAFAKPLIGDVEVNTFEHRHGDWEKKTLPLGRNLDLKKTPKVTTAHYHWGDVDLHLGPPTSQYGASHNVLSSGLYQFRKPISTKPFGYESLPYDIIMNVRPSVSADSPMYPFNNQREDFSPKIQSDIMALHDYLRTWQSAKEASGNSNTFANVSALPDFSPLGLERHLPDRGTAFDLAPDITIKDGKTNIGGKNRDFSKEMEKTAQISLDKFQFAPGTVPTDKPLFHSNLSSDIISQAAKKHDVDPREARALLASLGSVVQQFRDGLANVTTHDNKPFAMWATQPVGISLDKSYHGVHIAVPYQGFFLNPLSVTAKTDRGVAASYLHTMLHEAVHTHEKDHDEGFTTGEGKLISAFEDANPGLMDKLRSEVEELVGRHRDVFNALREVFNDESTRNIGGDAEGASRSAVGPGGARGLSGRASGVGEEAGRAGRGEGSAGRLEPSSSRSDIRRPNEGAVEPFDFSNPGGAGKDGKHYREVTIGDTTIGYSVPKGATVEVSRVETAPDARSQGSARAAMEEMVRAADENGVKLALTPDPLENGLNKWRLGKFYRSLGFVSNSGGAKDFTTRAVLVRKPKPVVKAQVPEDQTDTPEFKRWFGDSKVVDENGAPRIVYHGSPVRGFDNFDLSKVNPNDPDAPYNGFWFSSSRDDADTSGKFPWGRPNTPDAEVRPFFLSLKNPATRRQAYSVAREMETRDGYYPSREEVRQELERRGFDGVVHLPPAAFSAEDLEKLRAGVEVPTGQGKQTLKLDPENNTYDLYDPNVGGHVTGGWATPQEFLHEAGYGTYVAFRPKQIKSAIGNSGAFDPYDPRIHMQADSLPVSNASGTVQVLGPGLIGRLAEQPTEQEARLIEEIGKIAKQIVPTAKVIPTKELMVIHKVPQEGGHMQSKGQMISGAAYIDGPRRLIAWSLGSRDPVATVRHEAIHYLRNVGFFTSREWETLSKAAQDGDWLGSHRIDKRYPDLDEAEKIEEAVAEEFGKWNRNEATPQPLVRRLFARLRTMLDNTKRYLRSMFGKDATADDIFRDIAEGKVGRRHADGEPPISAEVRAQAADEPEGPPRNMDEGRDYIDKTAEDLAEHLRSAGPGTYERTLQHLAPNGPELFLDANWLQQKVMGPRTVAEIDTKSGRFWNAIKAEEEEGGRRLHDLRDNISETFLKMPRASQDRVNAVMELDRLANRTRADDGRSIIARNVDAEYARGSKPGEKIILTPEETKAYYGLQKMYRHAWDNIMEGTARRMGWIRPWSPAMADNIALINKAVETADHPRNRKAFQRLADVMAAMEDQRRSAYMPLMRFGDYYMSVRPKIDSDSLGGFPDTTWFELAERPALQFADVDPSKMLRGHTTKTGEIPDYAKDRLADLRKRFPADKYRVESGYLLNKPDALRSLSIPAVEKLLMLLESGVMDRLKTEASMGGFANKKAAREKAEKDYEDLYSDLVDAVQDEMYENLKAGFKKKAKAVPGYSSDWNRVLGSYMGWTSRHVARQIHGDNIERIYNDIQTNHPHKSIREYWQRWKHDDESPLSPISRIGMSANQVGFLWTLAMNPASTMSIMMHGPTYAMPVLSTGLGMEKAAGAFRRAYAEATSALGADTRHGLQIDIAKVGKTPDERQFLEKLAKDGDLHAKGADDVRSMGEKASAIWGEYGPAMKRSMDVVSSNIAAADQANRVATALAAYRLARDGNLGRMNDIWSSNQVWRAIAQRDGVSPETMGQFLLTQGVGEWGGRSRSEAGRSFVGRMASSLHGFQIRFLSNLLKQALRQGPSGRMALAWTLAALWAAAGLQGIPFVQDAENLADTVWKTLTKHDPMIAWRMRALLADAGLGKVGADLLLRGPLSSLSGVDFGSRLGFGDVITKDIVGPLSEGAQAALTVPSIAMGIYSGVTKKLASHQPASAAASVLPGGLRHPVQAAIDREHGIKSQTGKTTYVPARKVTAGDTAAEALGFTPLSVAREREHADYRYRAAHAHGSRPKDMLP